MGLWPGDQSIVSQVHCRLRTKYYLLHLQIATMAILVVAANTAFADFPRLSSILARDNYMPHVFGNRGDRLAFSSGILFLGAVSGLLLIAFRGNVDSLIHLLQSGFFWHSVCRIRGWWCTGGRRAARAGNQHPY